MAKGSIIAFEGEADLVSMQMRLLPTSSQILIMPSLHNYLDDGLAEGEQFDLPKLIRSTHNALLERMRHTETFLKNGSVSQSPLVFWHGGAAQAQAICVKAIMTHQTGGNDQEAQEIFNYVVEEGLAGLDTRWSAWNSQSCLNAGSPLEESGTDGPIHRRGEQSEAEEEDNDPITKAMRAADALDRETETLQPSTELDLTIKPRARCNSLPIYGYDDAMGEVAPFFVFGAQCHSADVHAATSPTHTANGQLSDNAAHGVPRLEVPHDLAPDRGLQAQPGTRCLDHARDRRSAPATPTFSYFLKTDEPDGCSTATFDLQAAKHDSLRTSVLSTYTELLSPGGLYPPPSHRKTKSMDSVSPSTPTYDDFPRFENDETPSAVTTPTPRAETFGYPERMMSMARSKTESAVQQLPTIEKLGPISFQAGRFPIVLDPVPKHKLRRKTRSTYVDKGTDAIDGEECSTASETVLPMLEHLVIHFKDSVPDLIVQRAIEAFKHGTYPTQSAPVPSISTPHEDGAIDRSGSPHPVYSLSQLANGVKELGSPGASSLPDADKQASLSSDCLPRLVSRHNPRNVKGLVRGPPIRDGRSAASLSQQAPRFHDFVVNPDSTAVDVQNALRGVLNDYVPPGLEDDVLRFSLLPELEALWQPIFRKSANDSPRRDSRRMDQILAVGSQSSVSRGFAAGVIARLEKLGRNPDGLNRSGRLDLRCLLAIAMQAYTAQPLSKQTAENPFNNTYLLASLLVPQLETYLAIHTEVRYLLLEYPPEHLNTIVAMQKLIGLDLMKVAQIVDCNSTERLPFTHIRGASISSQMSKENAAYTAHGHARSNSRASGLQISKANFLLTSRASEAELSTFIRAVTQILAGVSDFYKPQALQRTPPAPRPGPGRPQTTFSPFPKPSRSSPVTPNTPGRPEPLVATRVWSPITSTFDASPVSPSSDTASTIKNCSEEKRGVGSDAFSVSQMSWMKPRMENRASMYTFDPADDSDYDLEERRLMPIFLQKPKRPHESRKAMKFLGLS